MKNQESYQKKLEKIRAARVGITIDVDNGGVIERREIPFVMGVVGDFGGNPEVEQKRLKERSFVGIDRDNFDEVMKGVKPRTTYQVPNMLNDDGGRFGVDLTFKSLEDFRPEAVVAQVEPLRKLLEARTKLSDLRNKLAGNDKLEDILNDVLNSTEKMAQLGQAKKED